MTTKSFRDLFIEDIVKNIDWKNVSNKQEMYYAYLLTKLNKVDAKTIAYSVSEESLALFY